MRFKLIIIVLHDYGYTMCNHTYASKQACKYYHIITALTKVPMNSDVHGGCVLFTQLHK